MIGAGGDPGAPPLKKSLRKHSLACSFFLKHQLTNLPAPQPWEQGCSAWGGMCGKTGENTGIPRKRRTQPGSQPHLYHPAQGDPGQVLPHTPPPARVFASPSTAQSTHLCLTRVALVAGTHTSHTTLFGHTRHQERSRRSREALNPSRALPVLLAGPQHRTGSDKLIQSRPSTPAPSPRLTVYSLRRSLARRGNESSRPGKRRAAGISTEPDPP